MSRGGRVAAAIAAAAVAATLSTTLVVKESSVRPHGPACTIAIATPRVTTPDPRNPQAISGGDTVTCDTGGIQVVDAVALQRLDGGVWHDVARGGGSDATTDARHFTESPVRLLPCRSGTYRVMVTANAMAGPRHVLASVLEKPGPSADLTC